MAGVSTAEKDGRPILTGTAPEAPLNIPRLVQILGEPQFLRRIRSELRRHVNPGGQEVESRVIILEFPNIGLTEEKGKLTTIEKDVELVETSEEEVTATRAWFNTNEQSGALYRLPTTRPNPFIISTMLDRIEAFIEKTA